MPSELEKLMELAPLELRNSRVRRYHGDDRCVAMSVFTPEDQKSIRRLYESLQDIFSIVQGTGAMRIERFQAFVENRNFENLGQQMRQFGVASYAAHPSTLLAQVLHDIRGGGLSAILGRIAFWKMGRDQAGICETLHFLTRDHLKIMRNALLGLDDAKRNQDLELKLHSTDLIVQKWKGMQLQVGAEELKLAVTCPLTVPIAECCVEFGALDRILYNLLNNAARHTADHCARLALFPIPDEAGESLRFVLRNALRHEDKVRLAGIDLKNLFEPGVSTTGSGQGLAIVAEFVTNAFGLADPALAVEKGYLGARLLDGDFAVWFHWPIVAERLDDAA